MKYFIDGLTKEQLKREYKALAKKYHPDICKDKNANSIMAAINEEYDSYFAILTPNIDSSYQDIFQKKKKENKVGTRTSVVWMFKENGKDRWIYNALSMNGNWSYETYISNNDESWKGFNGGPCIVEYNIYLAEIFRSCRRVKDDLLMPNFDQMIDLVYADKRQSSYSENFSLDDILGRNTIFNMNRHHENIFYHVRKDDKEYILIGKTRNNSGMNSDNVPDLHINDNVVDIVFIRTFPVFIRNLKASIFKDYEIVDVYRPLDFVFLKYTGYRAAEFCNYYTLEAFPEYTERVDPDLISDRTVYFYAKRDIVRFRSVKGRQDIRYGYFNVDKLVKNLPNIDMNDIDDIQDYLDKVNAESDEKIRSMVKKGKIHIKI